MLSRERLQEGRLLTRLELVAGQNGPIQASVGVRGPDPRKTTSLTVHGIGVWSPYWSAGSTAVEGAAAAVS